MKYGSSIGIKYHEDGTVRTYPGNTVVAALTPGSGGYEVMAQLRQMVVQAKMESHVILLPPDSFHMTVISGLNDQVRKDTHWPSALPKEIPMEQVDDYISAAVERVGLPGPARMKFHRVHFSKNCMVVRLKPADEEQERILRTFRDQVAREVGLKLPGHDDYHFHSSLGYTWVIPEGDAAERMEALIGQMDAFLADQPAFTTDAPYMAYYRDMLAFSPNRIPR